MKLAVMQPYLFPYLGYYQLVAAVDRFVFFDDVNFINKGWINRNNVLQQNKASRFTLPLSKASQNRMINDIEISEYPKWRKDFIKQIEYNYKKAPYFSSIHSWLSDLLSTKEYRLVSELAADSVKSVAERLQLETKFGYSSQLDYQTGEQNSGQDKVLTICKILGGTHYINPRNGTELYDNEKFRDKQIQLSFINMDEIVYRQFEESNFVPNLSIIDVLMFNDTEQVKQLLKKYTLN